MMALPNFLTLLLNIEKLININPLNRCDPHYQVSM
jgi:hypothetical protein